jgi:DNA repair exonuclease SbcCD nuclease subunit
MGLRGIWKLMTKVLILGDLHITEKSIPELREIAEEISQYKANMIIQLGDFYDSHSPSPRSLEFGTELVKQWKKQYKKVIILSGTGKHDILNGVSIVDYLQHLGVKIVGTDYDLEIDNQKIKLGHFMLHESKKSYGTGKYGLKDLKGYDYCFLGHFHSPQKFNSKIHHIGSVRYQNFNELHDKNKQIAILEDGKLSFIPLKSPIPMWEIIPGSSGVSYLEEYLLKIDPRSKVRVIFNSFTQFKESLPIIKKYKHKFHQFKIKLDYKEKPVENFQKAMKETFKETQPLDKILINAIKQIEDKDVRELLEGVL